VSDIKWFDDYTNPMTLTNLPTPFDIYLPWNYENNEELNEDLIYCAWWDQNHEVVVNQTVYTKVNSSMYSNATLLQNFSFVPTQSQEWIMLTIVSYNVTKVNNPNFNTQGCSKVGVTDTHLICRCNHFTSFTGIFMDPVPQSWKRWISNIYEFIITLNWYSSIGFYILISITSLYLTLLFSLFVFETRKVLRKLKDLFKRRARLEKAWYQYIGEKERKKNALDNLNALKFDED
jgi:hypothetical protein